MKIILKDGTIIEGTAAELELAIKGLFGITKVVPPPQTKVIAQKKFSYKQVTCQMCGKTTPAKMKTKKFCGPCAIERDRANSLKHAHSRNPAEAPLSGNIKYPF